MNWGCVVDVLPADIPDGMGGSDRGEAVERWFIDRFCISHSTPYVCLDDLDLGYTRRGLPFVQTPEDLGLAGLRLDQIDGIISRLKGTA